MAGESSGQLEKLEITACSVDDGGNLVIDEDDKYYVMLNPTKFGHKENTQFSDEKALGEIGNRKRYSSKGDEKIDLEIIIDGTGVVTDDASITVETELAALAAMFSYDGDVHEPKHSRLVWGTFIFFGRLENMGVDYTLFKPSGEPLRAKVNLSFVRFMTDEEESKAANRSSPDLSHLVEIRQGDSLPLLCHRIYKDSQYYMDVARVNGIDNFRALTPGDKLLFPPLK